jgi:hypothetical protein
MHYQRSACKLGLAFYTKTFIVIVTILTIACQPTSTASNEVELQDKLAKEPETSIPQWCFTLFDKLGASTGSDSLLIQSVMPKSASSMPMQSLESEAKSLLTILNQQLPKASLQKYGGPQHRAIEAIIPLFQSQANLNRGNAQSKTQNQPDVFVVQFSQKGGYAIFKNSLAPELLGYSANGTFQPDQINPTLAFLLEKQTHFTNESTSDLTMEALTTLAKTTQEHPIFLPNPDADFTYEMATKCGMEISYKTYTTKIGEWQYTYAPPLIATNWHQDAPYNAYIPLTCDWNMDTKEEIKAPVGCVATAIAQILAYHQWPTHHENNAIDWRLLSGILDLNANSTYAAIDRMATLMEWTSRSLSTRYTCNASYSNLINAQNFLQNQGYNAYPVESFDPTKALQSIQDKRPLYIEGCRNAGGDHFCHAWILAGHSKITRTEKWHTEVFASHCQDSACRSVTLGTFVNTKDRTHELLFNNFGWGASSNLWMPMGVFCNKADCSDKNYTEGFRMLTQIHPKP